MGVQDNFSTNTTASIDVVATTRSTETVNYITDLLGELQTIAAISGLAHLSDDINSVMSKYTPETAQL